MRQGGENQRGIVILVRGYSEKAHCIGKTTRTYLHPNRDSLQKPIGGRVAVGKSSAQKHTKIPSQRSYLDPIRNSMQKKGEGVECARNTKGGRSVFALFHANSMLKKGMGEGLSET